MSIQEELARLEKEKKALILKDTEDKLQHQLSEASKYKDRVFFKATVTNRRKFMTYTWYKDAIIKRHFSGEPRKVFIKSSEIQVIYNLSYTSQISYKDKNEEEFNSDLVYRKIQNWSECNVDKFKSLVKLSKKIINHMYLEILEGTEPLYEGMTGIEHDKYSAIKKTECLLDIPYITLTNKQADYLGNNVFLRGHTYLLTKASLNYALKKLKIDVNNEDKYTHFLENKKYINRYDHTKDIIELRKLIKSYAIKEGLMAE